MTKPILYTAACYGTGNLGDDAIFAGLLSEYHSDYEVVQVYMAQTDYSPSVREPDLLREGFPEGVGRFIIGGGGLFFHSSICQNMLRFASKALEAKIPIDIRGVGFETMPPECSGDVSELLDVCRSITVRSTVSKQILERLGYSATVVEDFAYQVTPDIAGAKAIMPEFDTELPIIGIVTAGGLDNYREPVAVVTELVKKYNVLHVPHVRHLIGVHSNQVACGEIIYSSIGALDPAEFRRYKCLPYPNSPQIILGIYSLLSGVVSYRYHPTIFADMACVPLYARTGASCSKVRSWVSDHPDVLIAEDCRNFSDESGAILNDISLYFEDR